MSAGEVVRGGYFLSPVQRIILSYVNRNGKMVADADSDAAIGAAADRLAVSDLIEFHEKGKACTLTFLGVIILAECLAGRTPFVPFVDQRDVR